MTTAWFDSGLRQIACTSISGYQKYLSPHKGFSCAHRILYGGESCSVYIKRMVAQKGFKAAFQASSQRFQDCKQANLILRDMVRNSQTQNQENSKKRQREDLKQDNVCLDVINNACANFQCGSSSTDTSCALLDCGNCAECGSNLDCGSLDCGGFGDCGSSLDCGGCGSCGS